MRKSTIVLVVLSLAATVAVAVAGELAPAPATAKHPVVNDYGGVKVSDDYQWLEDSKSAEVHAWADAQNGRARAFLATLPAAKEIHGRVATLMKSRSPMWFALSWQGGQLFAMKSQPPKQQPFLVVRSSPMADGSERVLLDPMTIDPSGHTAIDWYRASLDGKLVAVSLSKNGSERGDLHVYDVASGKALPDVIEHVQNGTAGGSVAFTPDGSGLFYTRYPRAGEKPAGEDEFWQQVWFHKLGTPASADQYSLGKGLPRIAEIVLDSTEDGSFILADVSNGDGGEHEYFVHGADGVWKQVSKFSDKAVKGALGVGSDRSLYLMSIAGAPRGKIVKLPLAAPVLAKAKTIVPEAEGAIEDLTPTATRLWVSRLDGGPSRLYSYALDGGAMREEPTPPVSAVRGGVWLGGDDLLVLVLQYVAPSAWYRVSPTAKPQMTALAETTKADFSDVIVKRETATSKDGTKVPFTIIHKRSVTQNGANPTLLTGYGGFGVSLSPGFNPTSLVWLEQGGIVAIANLRGGGEFGDAWHKAGMLTQKQHVFDDFIGVAEKLVKDKWTQPKKLVIQGGSNGGLLMGAVTVQRPDLFGAVVSMVGLYDMMRSELSPNGAFITTEYGSVKNPEQRKALHAYSPYHHVVDGVAYPPMLLTSGDHDPRVDPMHSRKMVARLQAASSSKSPILLRTNANAGHGMGSSLDDRIAEAADIYAFIFSMLGVNYAPVPPRG